MIHQLCPSVSTERALKRRPAELKVAFEQL